MWLYTYTFCGNTSITVLTHVWVNYQTTETNLFFVFRLIVLFSSHLFVIFSFTPQEKIWASIKAMMKNMSEKLKKVAKRIISFNSCNYWVKSGSFFPHKILMIIENYWMLIRKIFCLLFTGHWRWCNISC